MEQKLEQNLIQGPSKVLPHSVPTLTPATVPSAQPKPLGGTTYRPPPPVIPTRLGVYESDYESDRYKYSGSESDVEPGIRNQPQQTSMETSFKSSGYTADTEEHSSYRKSESSYYETKSSSSLGNALPKLQPEPPAPIYFTPKPQPQVQPQVVPPSQSNFSSQEAKVRIRSFSLCVYLCCRSMSLLLALGAQKKAPPYTSKKPLCRYCSY